MSWLPALVCALLVGGSLGRSVQLVERPQDLDLHQARPVKYVITGQKDSDGRWTEQVKMEHGEEDWHIEVDHMTIEVGEGQPKVKITATFSAKSRQHGAAAVPDEDSSEPAESGRGGATPVFQLFPRSHRDWFGAKRQCEEWGGHLAIPDTKPKMRELTRILRKHIEDIGESTGAFLGFNDLKREGHFVTVLGKPLFGSQDSTWSPHWFQAGQPDDDKAWTKDGEDCGSFRSNGGLNDVPCRYNLPFVCEKAAVTEKAVGEEEGSTIELAAPENEQEEDSLLQLFQDPRKDWYQARTACLEWGGHLAAPDTDAKNSKMMDMLKMMQSTTESSEDDVSAFVNYNHIWKMGSIYTFGNKGDAAPSSSASKLFPWLPQDEGWTMVADHCGVVPASGGLDNVPCSRPLPYFCEKSPSVATPEDPAEQSGGDDVQVQHGSHEVDTLTGAATPEDPAEQSGGDDVQVQHGSHEVDTLTGAATPEDPAEQSGDGDVQEVQDVLNEADTLILFVTYDLDWFEANDACRDWWGGHFAIPDSAEKMEAMSAKLKLANVPAAFLGFSDQKQEGHFVTIFGKPVFSKSSSWSPVWWREDQPDDDKSWFKDGEDCGSVRVGGGLNDVPCRHHLPFFCEKPLPAGTEADEATRVRDGHPTAPPDDQTDAVWSEDMSSSEERAFWRSVSSIETLPGKAETLPADVPSSEKVESADEALTKLISDIHAVLNTLDSPISAQSNEKKESSKEDAVSHAMHEY